MRITNFLVVLLTLLIPATAFGDDVQVDFIKKFEAGSPRFLTMDEQEGWIYTTQFDGTVKVFEPDGPLLMIIESKTPDGKRVLKRPTGITFYKDRIYVADEALNAVSIFKKDGTFVDSFGRGGNGPKEFNSPQGIRVNQGVIYVADRGNKRIQLFGLDGVYVGSFGTKGRDDEVLKTPTDLAFFSNGDIYIPDNKVRLVKFFGPDHEYKALTKRVGFPFSIVCYGDGFIVSDDMYIRMTVFDLQGRLITTFGGEGTGPGQLESMGGIYLDAKSNLYIADQKGGAVHIFQLKHINPVGEMEHPPPSSVRMAGSVDITVGRILWDSKGKVLYAIDEKEHAVLLLRGGEVQKKFEVDGWEPSGMALASDGALWVSDRKRDRLLKLGPDGEVLIQVGSSGSGDGRLDDPEDIVITEKGIIFVADKGNKRVQLFNTDGMFIKVLGKGGTSSFFKRPVSLALDQDEILYVLDDRRREVLVFSRQGLPLNEFGKDVYNEHMLDEPVDIAVNGEEIFVLDAGLGQVLVFDRKGTYLRRFGSKGSGRGEFKNSRSLDALSMTRIAIADTGNNRIQELKTVYTPDFPRSVTAVAGMREAKITWKPSPESFVAHYNIYRGSSRSGPFELIAESTEAQYADTTLKPGMTYYYRVTAVAMDGNESRGSLPVSVTAQKYKPNPPMGVQAEPGVRSVKLTWSENQEPFVSGYSIYRKALDGTITQVGEAKGTEFTDTGLNPNTTFTYLIAALSIDGEESKTAPVRVTTLVATRPPLEVEVLELDDVFSNMYKIYEKEGMGRIRLVNNTNETISKITVLFSMKEFMDFPFELQAEDLSPDTSKEYVLKAVFNNKMLNVTEDIPVQVEIKATYYYGGQPKVFSTNRTVNIYEKHRMTWDVDGRIATFITPKDPVALEFSRDVVTQYRDTSDPLVLGGMLFDALGVMGMTYLPDPTNPYQVTSGRTDFVDYIQYPRETLKRKSGDCDDLVSMYATLLESVGIPTKMLFYPGHMFMMFSVGFVSEVGEEDLDGMLVPHDGRVWAPVEATLLGTSFISAWEKGSTSYQEWGGRGLRILDPRDAWERFKPASLQPSTWRPQLVLREHISQRFAGDYRTLVRLRIRLKTAQYAEAFRKDPDDVNALLQAGIIYAEAGETSDAKRLFEKALIVEPRNAALKNNLGNIYFHDGEYEKACVLYEDASRLDPEDALVWVNLARCMMKIERQESASDAFRKAVDIDESVERTYRSLSLRLMGGF